MTKTITVYDPKYVTQLEDDCHAMRTALTSIRYINNGPDQGSSAWRAETAASLAENTLLAIENSRAGKLNPAPAVPRDVMESKFAVEARRILSVITETLDKNVVIRTNIPLDQRVNALVRAHLDCKDDNKALKEELAEASELLAKYEEVFQSINSLAAKVT